MKEESLLSKIVNTPALHARWLATLSYLELCGAQKIAHYLPQKVEDSELLQHAAEEFRHAYFFNRQISKIFPSTHKEKSTELLCGRVGRRYLSLLDLSIARYIRQHAKKRDIRRDCYLLTSYIIEIRAQKLYTVYESVLRKCASPISLRGILKEEIAHLHLMKKQVSKDPFLEQATQKLISAEEKLFDRMLQELSDQVTSFDASHLSQSA